MIPKIIPIVEVASIAEAWRRLGRKIVLTNGCFDLIHPGHIELFAEAKRQGDILFVAVNDDDGVRALKGPSRPIVPIADRMEVLAAFADVDHVVSFPGTDPLSTVKAICPDVLVKGDDYAESQIIGAAFVRSRGGRVHLVTRKPNSSTTSMIQRTK